MVLPLLSGVLAHVLLVPQIGLLGVWVSMFIDWIVRAVIFLIRFLSGRWKTKKVI